MTNAVQTETFTRYKKLLEVDRINNDLFSRLVCDCREVMKFSGYADNYFYDEVNKEFKLRCCPSCKQEYYYKWQREGLWVMWDIPLKSLQN